MSDTPEPESPDPEGDSFEQAVLINLLQPPSRPLPHSPRPPTGGWVLGILVGTLIGFWAFPAVRNTLVSQLQFALIVDNLPWMKVLDSRQQQREVQRLDLSASRLPADYLIQVGRATALADVWQHNAHSPQIQAPTPDPNDDRTLFRLGKLAHDFPLNPGAYAHLARYMMGQRVKIQRVEIQSDIGTRSTTIRAQDFRMIEWALKLGELCDKGNALWQTLLAVACFAYGKDAQALQALERASRMDHWDAFIYEEVLGQWRLYSETYGDNGAAQQLTPLSLIAFPHLQEIRSMGRMAFWHAQRALQKGDTERAIRIRRWVARLGSTMRESSQWAYEAIFGTDLFFLATTDTDAPGKTSTIQNIAQWEEQGKDFKNLLLRLRKRTEWSYYRSQAETACQLRDRIETARMDTSSPGMPPGIPLRELFGNWMAGVCLLQQGLALGLVSVGASWWRTHFRKGEGVPRRFLRVFSLLFPLVFVIWMSLLFWGAQPTGQVGALWLLSLLVLFAKLLQVLYIRRQRRAIILFSWQWEGVEAIWRHGTFWRSLLTIVIPFGVVIFFARPMLSYQHPVVVILTSLTNINTSTQEVHASQSLILALLSYGLPLAVLALGGIWAFWRKESPFAGMLLAISHLTIPLLACLFLGYLVLLNDTLRLDAESTRGIHEAAQHDLHWILTHSGASEADED